MGKGEFSAKELEYLRGLDAVESVEPSRITYSAAFKEEFVRRYRAGEKPKAIFESVGLYADLLGYKRIERACAHWRGVAAGAGCVEPAATSAPAAHPARTKSREQKAIEAQVAQIAALKAQVKELRTADCLARRALAKVLLAKKAQRFSLIDEARAADPKLNVSAACKVLGVSRSGYYEWEASREQDARDFLV